MHWEVSVDDDGDGGDGGGGGDNNSGGVEGVYEVAERVDLIKNGVMGDSDDDEDNEGENDDDDGEVGVWQIMADVRDSEARVVWFAFSLSCPELKIFNLNMKGPGRRVHGC